MTFRQAVAKDWPIRVLDFVGHCLLAWLLPGVWWWQFLPDLLVPVLWARSMAINQPVPYYSPLLIAHRVLHSWALPGILLLTAFSGGHRSMRYLGFQWLTHLCLDLFTHRRWERDIHSVQRGN